MDSSHKRRHKKERSNQSYKHLLEKQKLEEEKRVEKDKATTSQEQEPVNEEDKFSTKKVITFVVKKSLDKKSKRIKMSEKKEKSRDEVMAAREAKKLSKNKNKNKDSLTVEEVKAIVKERKKSLSESKDDKPGKERKKSQSDDKPGKERKKSQSDDKPGKERKKSQSDDQPGKERKKSQSDDKSKDEVDKASIASKEIKSNESLIEKSKEQIMADRAAKKAAKAQKKGAAISADEKMTVKDVVETLKDIKDVANEVKGITAEVKALDLKGKDLEGDSGKSKAELKAERRAKQEAQRAAKQAAADAAKPAQPAPADTTKPSKLVADVKKTGKAMSPKPKTVKKVTTQNGNRVNWFGQEYNDNEQILKTLPVNSHIHPAFIKLGVQLSTRVVIGENARCIAFLDALKKMTKDYTLPAKTEFGRGLDSHLTETMSFVGRVRRPSACELNAVKFYRHHLTQLPNNVNEYDAKKTLQDEIDRYIREQIDVAGEAISADVRKKISPGDVILTYGFSSLVERCLVDAHAEGIQFRGLVCGARGAGSAAGAKELTRRLRARGVPVDEMDITALGGVMQRVSKVLLGASSILNNGAVLAAAGTASVARAARLRNVPVLVACETHKFSERVQTDAFVYNELGDPNDLNVSGDPLWELRDWRGSGLAVLNLTYDVTPASLVTAVVTELAILPCSSAPVVLRFRGTAYGI